jgi:hypothetical protein
VDERVSDGWRRFAGCVALLAASLVAFPAVALLAARWLPRLARNALFFWPQYVLLPNGLLPSDGGPPRLFRSATVVVVVLWLAATAGYVHVTRRWRRRSVLLAFLPAVAVLLELALRVVAATLGLHPMLDGP